MKIRGYTLCGVLRIFYFKFRTLFIFPRAKLIRFPFYFRNSGNIKVEAGLSLGVGCRIDVHPGAMLGIGKNVQINDYCHIGCAGTVLIGDDSLIASKVFISDHDHAIRQVGSKPSETGLIVRPVTIGRRVWIGEGVAILKGVKIGDDAIIGANSVVTRDVPAATIVAGNPARLIRKRHPINQVYE
jgi:lipopolysaccharide O-acetyltransferase